MKEVLWSFLSVSFSSQKTTHARTHAHTRTHTYLCLYTKTQRRTHSALIFVAKCKLPSHKNLCTHYTDAHRKREVTPTWCRKHQAMHFDFCSRYEWNSQKYKLVTVCREIHVIIKIQSIGNKWLLKLRAAYLSWYHSQCCCFEHNKNINIHTTDSHCGEEALELPAVLVCVELDEMAHIVLWAQRHLLTFRNEGAEEVGQVKEKLLEVLAAASVELQFKEAQSSISIWTIFHNSVYE